MLASVHKHTELVVDSLSSGNWLRDGIVPEKLKHN